MHTHTQLQLDIEVEGKKLVDVDVAGVGKVPQFGFADVAAEQLALAEMAAGGETAGQDKSYEVLAQDPRFPPWTHDPDVVARDPTDEVGELTCKWHPFPRAYHTAAYFNQRVWLIGGKRTNDDYNDDVWYRDSELPKAFVIMRPETQTADTEFTFRSDKSGAVFQVGQWPSHSTAQPAAGPND